MFKIGDKVKHKTCAPEEIGIVQDVVGYDHYVIKWSDTGYSTDNADSLEPIQQKRIYLAGPMSGIPYFNFPAFHRAAAELRAQGYHVFNPAETDNESVKLNETGDEVEAAKHGFCRRRALAEDTQWIALHADAIALLPGWEKSSGARAEYALAEALGLGVILL